MHLEKLFYQNESGSTKVDAYFNDATIWMSQRSMAELYQTSPQNITLHIKNIYADGELDESSTCKNYLQVQNEGTRQVEREIKIYDPQCDQVELFYKTPPPTPPTPEVEL